MYKLVKPTVIETQHAIVRNIRMHSYKPYLVVIIGLLVCNLAKGLFAPTPANATPVEQPAIQQPTIQLVKYSHSEAECNAPNVYHLIIQDDNSVILRQHGREVHVFQRAYTPNRNLFYVLDRDNR